MDRRIEHQVKHRWIEKRLSTKDGSIASINKQNQLQNEIDESDTKWNSRSNL